MLWLHVMCGFHFIHHHHNTTNSAKSVNKHNHTAATQLSGGMGGVCPQLEAMPPFAPLLEEKIAKNSHFWQFYGFLPLQIHILPPQCPPQNKKNSGAATDSAKIITSYKLQKLLQSPHWLVYAMRLPIDYPFLHCFVTFFTTLHPMTSYFSFLIKIFWQNHQIWKKKIVNGSIFFLNVKIAWILCNFQWPPFFGFVTQIVTIALWFNVSPLPRCLLRVDCCRPISEIISPRTGHITSATFTTL